MCAALYSTTNAYDTMTQNLYKTPAAAVSDPAIPTPPKPTQIQLAVRTLWVLFVLGLITLHPWIRGEWWVSKSPAIPAAAMPVFSFIVITFMLIVCIFNAGMIWLVSRRHGWARWGLLALVLVGTWSLNIDVTRSISETPLAAIFDISCVLLDYGCCYLLFISPGARWFRKAPQS